MTQTKSKRRTRAIVSMRRQYTRRGLIQILRAAGVPMPFDARVYVNVPGGGDWSNTTLDLDDDAGHGVVITISTKPYDQQLPDGPDAGKLYSHAWVEEGALIWQGGIYQGQRVYFSCLKAEYLSFMQVQECTRYSLYELYIENRKSGHYGPWKPEYQALGRKAES